MADKIKKGREKDAEKMREFYRIVQKAKGDIGLSAPAEAIPGFSLAWAGLEALEAGCREVYATMRVPS